MTPSIRDTRRRETAASIRSIVTSASRRVAVAALLGHPAGAIRARPGAVADARRLRWTRALCAARLPLVAASLQSLFTIVIVTGAFYFG
jgi:hypothetical protein